MNPKTFLAGFALALLAGIPALRAAETPADRAFTDTFAVAKGDFASIGRNPYFILEPGYQHVYEGKEKRKKITLTITVLDETKVVDGVETRVVVEREEEDGEVVEISRNFFAIDRKTANVYYFGEEVDIYEDGKVVKHEGAWQSGVKGARFGLAVPSLPLLGARYYQEVAPGAALDRAEVASLSETIETPAGKFTGCLKTVETTPLEPGNEEAKFYAPGVGLIKDGPVKLVRHGVVKK